MARVLLIVVWALFVGTMAVIIAELARDRVPEASRDALRRWADMMERHQWLLVATCAWLGVAAIATAVNTVSQSIAVETRASRLLPATIPLVVILLLLSVRQWGRRTVK